MTLHLGDCREVMAPLESASVDVVVTDPPYELGFMGRAWDASGIAYDVSVWRECLRVLKPGGYLLAFGGTRTYHRLACAIEDAGFEIRDSLHWIYGSGFPKGKACLKPAHEPIVMARKPDRNSAPLAGLDACRVAHDGRGIWGNHGQHPEKHLTEPGSNGTTMNAGWHAPGSTRHDAGRWPPNLLLSGEAAAEMDRQSGDGQYNKGARPQGAKTGAASIPIDGLTSATYADTGGASRFFPVFRYEAKASSKERPRLSDGTAWPTVKPLDLMRWLVRLVTPPGGIVLDPFAGSGTTGQACALEALRCVLIERDPVAAELTRVRLSKPVQPCLSA